MERFRRISSVFCGIAGFLWGKLDGLLLGLIMFMMLDYLTGIAVAFHRKNLSSQIGFSGLMKKGFILIIVAIGHILDTQILEGTASVCRSTIIGFYLANEGLSILENAGLLGIPLPKKLKEILLQLKDSEK